jgi:hypothetical protein
MLVCLALILLSGPFLTAQTATLTGDPVHPAMANNWLESRLFFGLSLADAPADPALEARWQHFLDHEVTPRFPAGLTVLDGYGQWLPKAASSPKRLRSKVLVILYPASAENAERIDAIRTAWKKLTGEQSVLKVTEPADVSF